MIGIALGQGLGVTLGLGHRDMRRQGRNVRVHMRVDHHGAVGGEGAGEVVAVGDGVTNLGPGDRVAFSGSTGSYAELTLIRCGLAAP